MIKKILIADDNADIRELLKTILFPLGHQILVAKDGAETFSICRKEKPHLVILDIMMPFFSGYQVLRRLKRDESFSPHPKILILSAKSQPEDIKQAEMLGCDSYFVKPFSNEELVEKVEELLSSKDYIL
ncbi:MAG: response regulator [Elusimicrobia bacterium]|nr:response regulator [Elusimicrobiota bacterium]